MRITIHRGTNQIGGCVTEYELNGWKLFVDYGEQLPGNLKKDLEIEGLNKGDLSKSALLITHYHSDHVGNIDELDGVLPIYMGEVSKEILSELSNHLKSVSEKKARIANRLEKVKTFKTGEVIKFGDFLINPINLDHSAFDAHAFKIEAGGEKVFHTGDFRCHGFRSRNFFNLIDKYVGKIDYVVCEATNIARPDVSNKSETQLQREFIEAFKKNKGNIIYISTTNIDRLFSIYLAALKLRRPFYVDPFQKRLMDRIAKGNSMWTKSKLFRYGYMKPTELMYESGTDNYLFKPNFEEELKRRGYVLIARATNRFDTFIKKFPEGKKIYLSMWKGYINPANKSYNPRLARSVGSDPVYLHTSGHIDIPGLYKFFDALSPKAIIPIHTDNPSRFAELFNDKWPVVLLEDGESFSTRI